MKLKNFIYVLLAVVICLLAALFIFSNKYYSARDELVTTTSKLTNTQNDLTSVESQLSSQEQDNIKLQNSIKELNANIQELSIKYNMQKYYGDTLSSKYSIIQTEYTNIQTEYTSVTTGFGYVLNDPTYSEMLSFIASDHTNNNTYNDQTYNCYDYSKDVVNNAVKQHIRAGFVYITYPDSAHAIVAFNTTDKGIIYIEPQTDEQVNLQLNRHYYQCVIPKPGYYIPKPDYDDTVINFGVIW